MTHSERHLEVPSVCIVLPVADYRCVHGRYPDFQHYRVGPYPERY
jgi:hypothetical protein